MATTSIMAHRGTEDLREALYLSVNPDVRKNVMTMDSRELREFTIAQIVSDVRANSKIFSEEITKRFEEVQINLTKLDNGQLSTVYKGIKRNIEEFQQDVNTIKLKRGLAGTSKDVENLEAPSRDRDKNLTTALLRPEEFWPTGGGEVLFWG